MSTGTSSLFQGVVLRLNFPNAVYLSLLEFDSLRKDSQRVMIHWLKKPEAQFKTDLGLSMFGKIAQKQGKWNYRIEITIRFQLQPE